MNIATLRLAEPADALCLGALATQVFLDTYASQGIRAALAREARANTSAEAFAAVFADADVAIVLAEHDQHLVGFAQLTQPRSHAPLVPGPAAELNRLYVQARFAGRGIGQALLQRAEELAAARGAAALWLTAWSHNARALAFYARAGYAVAGRTIHRFDGEEHPNHLFVRALQASGPR